MKFVEPIKTKKTVDNFKQYFRQKNQHKQLLLFAIGINTSLRISDILQLKWNQILSAGKLVPEFTVKEQKTGKTKRIKVNSGLASAVKEYMKHYNSPKGYVFSSNSHHTKGKPWTRQYAWKMLKAAAKAVNFDGNMGTHSLRKTFGYHAYRSGASLDTLMVLFNHSSPRITALYLGFTWEKVSEAYNMVNL